MPSTAKIKRTATADLTAMKTLVEIENVPYTAFVTKCVLQAGENPSHVEIECPLSNNIPDDVAVPPSMAGERWWFKELKHGARADVWIHDGSRKILVMTGTVQIIKHSIEQDMAQLTVVDDRQLLSGVPVRGCFVYDPLESKEDAAQTAYDDLQSAERGVKDAQTAYDNDPTPANSTALSDATTAKQTAQSGFDDLGGPGGAGSSVIFDDSKYPIFNKGGAPNMVSSPYGPVFAPFEWWGSTADDPTASCRYWDLTSALEYLRNSCYEGGRLWKLAQSWHNDYVIVLSKDVSWPATYFASIREDVLNLGDDMAAARDQKDNNREGDQVTLPEVSLRGLYVNQAISRLARQAGAYDLYISAYKESNVTDALYGGFDFESWKSGASAKGLLNYTPSGAGPDASSFADQLGSMALESGFLTQMEGLSSSLSSSEQALLEDFQNTYSDWLETDANGGAAPGAEGSGNTSGKSTVAIVQTAPTGYADGISLHAAAGEEVTGKQIIVEGVIERDSRPCYTAATVAGAPVMLETKLHFIPTAGSTINEDGSITFGAGSAVIDTDIPAGSTLLPAWSRQWRKVIGTTTEVRQTGGEEYDFLNLVATAKLPAAGGGEEDISSTTVAFDIACAKYPRVFAAFKISNAFNWYANTIYDGKRIQPSAIPPIALPHLLTRLQEIGSASMKRTLHMRATVEHYYQPAEASSYVWGCSTILDTFEVDVQGVIYLNVLREMSKQNTLHVAGSWLGHVTQPMDIRPKALRVTLAFALPFRILESISLPKSGDNYVNDATQYMLAADPRSQGKYFHPNYQRSRLIDVGDAYREYLRIDSYPTPQSAGGTKATDMTGANEWLTDQKDGVKNLAIRQLGASSYVRKTGLMTLNQIMLTNPGTPVSKIVDQLGFETECESVVKTVIHDFKRQMTTLELGSVI